jgi:CRISPR-associated endoribonuclease Cas6
MPDFPDLYAMVIRLRPVPGGPPPDPRGHNAQALFLNLLGQVAPELSERLHADALSKPYTVAVLPAPGRARRADDLVELRVAFTHAELFPPVTRALLHQSAGSTLRLGRAHLALVDVQGAPGSHPWAGYSAFAELAASVRAADDLTLEFVTPAAIGQGTRADGRQRLALLPTPELVFGSIARRWNELAPPELALDRDLLAAACADTLVSRYALETAQISLGKGPQKGFVGICTYEPPPDADQARMLSLLAGAVFYLGIGMKTARGMGLCRRINGQP